MFPNSYSKSELTKLLIWENSYNLRDKISTVDKVSSKDYTHSNQSRAIEVFYPKGVAGIMAADDYPTTAGELLMCTKCRNTYPTNYSNFKCSCGGTLETVRPCTCINLQCNRVDQVQTASHEKPCQHCGESTLRIYTGPVLYRSRRIPMMPVGDSIFP